MGWNDNRDHRRLMMIVYCEECGFKNDIDETRIHEENPAIACRKCGDLLRFYGLKAKALKTRASKPVSEPVLKSEKNSPPPLSSLILKYEQSVILVDELRSRVTIGRQKGNDIQVPQTRVSRLHATVTLKEGKYILTDQSSNGTYVHLRGSEAMTIKKEAIPLTCSGVIGLGCKVEFGSPDAIHILFTAS